MAAAASRRPLTERGVSCDVTLAEGLDLGQVYEDQDPDFFIRRNLKSKSNLEQ